jgi:hypothetical protein
MKPSVAPDRGIQAIATFEQVRPEARVKDVPELHALQAISSNPPAPDEVDFGESPIVPLANPEIIGDIVAGAPFDLTITLRRQIDGSINTEYRGTVQWESDDRTMDPAYPVILPPPYQFTAADQGVHTFTGFVLRTVAGTGHIRSLTISGTDNLITRIFYVNMWFYVKATREGLVGQRTACGRVIKKRDHFVALPAHGLCKVPILLAYNFAAVQTKVLDIGPYFGSNSRMDDPYWNLRGRPQTEIAKVGNRAGIDLADGTFLDTPPKGLGLTDNTRIYWRFL